MGVGGGVRRMTAVVVKVPCQWRGGGTVSADLICLIKTSRRVVLVGLREICIVARRQVRESFHRGRLGSFGLM